MGRLYDSKTKEGDANKAFNWYLKAANHNNKFSQYWIAERYEKGEGVTQNFRTALMWYLKAAELGYGKAQYKCYLYYEHGFSIEKDSLPVEYDKKSAFWALKAAEQGYPEALDAIISIYLQGRGVKKDYILALKWALIRNIPKKQLYFLRIN